MRWWSVTLLFAFVWAQSTIEISGLEGERLILYVDGERVNEEPMKQVRLSGLDAGTHRIKLNVINAEGKGQYLIKYIEVEDGYLYRMAVKYRPEFKDYVLRNVETVPLSQVSQTQQATTNQGQQQGGTMQQGINININISESEEQVSISGGIAVSGSGGGVSAETEVQEEETHVEESHEEVHVHGHAHEEPAPQPAPPPPPPIGPGCYPVDPYRFSQMLEQIRSKDFEETKMTVAKQIIKNNCITSAQLKEILKSLDFEQNKLSLAKFAYHYVSDPQNYYIINDVFDFEFSVQELNRYIEGNPAPSAAPGPPPAPNYNVPGPPPAPNYEPPAPPPEPNYDVPSPPGPQGAPGYQGYYDAGGCAPPPPNKFYEIKQRIENLSASTAKMALAKQVIQDYCFSSAQIKSIVETFFSEYDRLRLAKYAYDYVYDPENYYVVNDALSSPSSVEELAKYIQSKRR